MIAPLRWEDGVLLILDQTLLPPEESWLRCERPEQVADAIGRLAVRGAPAIGVAAAYGLALADADDFDEAADLLAAARPTAVNLRWAVEQVRAAGPGGALETARAIEERERDATGGSPSTARRCSATTSASSRTATPARWPRPGRAPRSA